MISLLAAFVAGWICCILIGQHRNRVNQTPTEVYTQSGKRVR